MQLYSPPCPSSPSSAHKLSGSQTMGAMCQRSPSLKGTKQRWGDSKHHVWLSHMEEEVSTRSFWSCLRRSDGSRVRNQNYKMVKSWEGRVITDTREKLSVEVRPLRSPASHLKRTSYVTVTDVCSLFRDSAYTSDVHITSCRIQLGNRLAENW